MHLVTVNMIDKVLESPRLSWPISPKHVSWNVVLCFTIYQIIKPPQEHFFPVISDLLLNLQISGNWSNWFNIVSFLKFKEYLAVTRREGFKKSGKRMQEVINVHISKKRYSETMGSKKSLFYTNIANLKKETLSMVQRIISFVLLHSVIINNLQRQILQNNSFFSAGS